MEGEVASIHRPVYLSLTWEPVVPGRQGLVLVRFACVLFRMNICQLHLTSSLALSLVTQPPGVGLVLHVNAQPLNSSILGACHVPGTVVGSGGYSRRYVPQDTRSSDSSQADISQS